MNQKAESQVNNYTPEFREFIAHHGEMFVALARVEVLTRKLKRPEENKAAFRVLKTSHVEMLKCFGNLSKRTAG